MGQTDNLVPQSFFSVSISNENIQHHPFVKRRVIPALEKTHAPQISALKLKYRKRMARSKLSPSELEDKAWGFVIWELVNHYLQLQGTDRMLRFGLLAGGGHTYIIWDNHQKSLYASNEFRFSVLLANKDEGFEDDDDVSLRGKLSFAVRDGKRYPVLKIYFYVHQMLDGRQADATDPSPNVGLLCELPYFFIRHDHYETLNNAAATENFLELFELTKEDNDLEIDFIPTDELGEMAYYDRFVRIGNKYVTITID